MTSKHMKKFKSSYYQSNANVIEIFFPPIKLAKIFISDDCTPCWHGCNEAGFLMHHSWKH